MNKDLLSLVKEIALLCSEQKLMVATAESCTGGGLSYWLTKIPGSSCWFERGFVTYSNTAKIEMLGVSKKTLENEGAVSEQTAREMAEGALKYSKAKLSVAITGIAGPEGGSAEKPVGTVWFGLAQQGAKTQAELQLFAGDREGIRKSAIAHACILLLATIKH